MESSVRGIIMNLLKDVSCEWGDGRTALKNINLEIKKGEFVLISRKSGSGKSTLGSVIIWIIKRAIAIASIYAMTPKVLILDEPSANLDIKTTFDLFSILKK